MTGYERSGDYRPSEKSTVGVAITFLFIGLGIGALSALLFAPRSGQQTRRLLRRTYEDAVDDLETQANELRERGAEWASQVREQVKEKVTPLRDRLKF